MAVLTPSMSESEVVLEFPANADGIEKALEIASEMNLQVSKSETGNFMVKISADNVRELQEISEQFLSKATEYLN